MRRPCSPLFTPAAFEGNVPISKLSEVDLSEEMSAALNQCISGESVSWGIPFKINDVVIVKDESVFIDLNSISAKWIIFMHTADVHKVAPNADGFISPMRGEGQLGEHVADYIMTYADKTEERVSIRRRYQIGAFNRIWGENCFEAVAHKEPYPVRQGNEQLRPGWGWSQTRVSQPDLAFFGQWINWLWAWENPKPEMPIIGIRFEPKSGITMISAISAGNASSHPLRWETRQKACFSLPKGEAFLPDLDEIGELQQIQIDMGHIISASRRPIYPNDNWEETYNNKLPDVAEQEILVEYTAHPDASFHLSDGKIIPVSDIQKRKSADTLQPVSPSTQKVLLRTIAKENGKCTPVKLHVHGEWGEYLAPTDRHRILNCGWFEDYSVDFTHMEQWYLPLLQNSLTPDPGRTHFCTYIPGETAIDLPLGTIYIEVSKGFEIKPIRKIFEVTPATEEIVIEVEKVLPWREKGWVTADTHVHFLSPTSALLEGSAEGVNIVNLLASQWGELVTNVGDFDGRTTWASKEAGGDGEYMVRVGTENRQHVLGHISLLGYNGRIISPMTTGGPDESALGDPIGSLLTEWARQCKKQGGVVVLPHFPNPRAEHAASIVSGDIDAVEMTAWGNLYGGIDPYSLSDWYRYLNCGYLIAAVGGTDKMTSATAVGTVRTYAHIDSGKPFTYESWMEAVRRAETFVTYGPLLELTVDGQPMGSEIEMSTCGGTVDVVWQAASVTIPMSRIDLIVNGEIKESLSVQPWESNGHWSVKLEKSSWLALLIRGHYTDKPEIIVAHSSPVMVNIKDSPMLASADAVTILEQIEGAIAYIDTVGTRAEDVAYKRMRLVLTSTYRTLHNRLHQLGSYHDHSPITDHMEHH